MFAVDLDTLLFAAEGDTRSHFQWLSETYGKYAAKGFFEKITRGYFLDGKIVAYVGFHCSAIVNHTDLKKAISGFQGLGCVIKTIGLGTYPIGPQPWPSIVEMSRRVSKIRSSIK